MGIARRALGCFKRSLSAGSPSIGFSGREGTRETERAGVAAGPIPQEVVMARTQRKGRRGRIAQLELGGGPVDERALPALGWAREAGDQIIGRTVGVDSAAGKFGKAYQVLVLEVVRGTERGGQELRSGELRAVHCAGAMIERLVDHAAPQTGDVVDVAYHGLDWTKDRRRQFGYWAFAVVDRRGRPSARGRGKRSR